MNVSKTSAPVVFVDADNTLWDADGVYAHAQLRLLKGVEDACDRVAAGANKLDFVREIDQAIAARHHRGLRYPCRLLIQAVARALVGESPESAAKAVWKGANGDILSEDATVAIETQFANDLRDRPILLKGVEAGLKRLHASGALILVLTEGNRDRVRRTASEYGLMPSIDRVIESPKIPRLYNRVLQLTGRPKESFMIGDQLQRDIAPAKAAELTTIYVPGRFKPRWEPHEHVVGPSYSVQSFDQAVEIILHGKSKADTPAQTAT